MLDTEPRILVVDDNSMNRKILATMLKIKGFHADCAENGALCMEKLKKADYHVVLLDLDMPVMDGYQVLEAMRDDPGLNNIPVIVISASDSLEDIIKSINMGAADHLPKPFNPVLLHARLTASLKKVQQKLEKTALALSSLVEVRDVDTSGRP